PFMQTRILRPPKRLRSFVVVFFIVTFSWRLLPSVHRTVSGKRPFLLRGLFQSFRATSISYNNLRVSTTTLSFLLSPLYSVRISLFERLCKQGPEQPAAFGSSSTSYSPTDSTASKRMYILF